MKRALALAAMLASAAAMSSPALAAGTPQYGSVKLQWNVSTALTALIHTSYTAGFAFAAPAGNLANPAGTCAAAPGGANADLTMDYGTITPSLVATVACTYLNALAASVTDNDAAGVKIYEYFDAALPAGTNICAFPNTGAAFPMTPAAALATSTRAGVGPAVYTAGACAAGGGEVKAQGGGGALVNGGSGPGQVGGAGESYQGAAVTNAFLWASDAAADPVVRYAGEDLQLNVGTAATSGLQSAIMTVQFIPN